jgi:hypothetical protein
MQTLVMVAGQELATAMSRNEDNIQVTLLLSQTNLHQFLAAERCFFLHFVLLLHALCLLLWGLVNLNVIIKYVALHILLGMDFLFGS